MQKVKVVINQTVRRYNVSHKGIKFSSSTNVVGVGKSAYDIYKETTTDNPILSEVDWIHSLYGEDGITPTIGANGNWFIGNKDTGTVASNGNTVPKPYFNVPMKCPIPYVGLESEIEDGWSLCDGRNVVGYGLVPDMRGRFIVGADPRTASMPTNSDNNLKNYGTAGNTGGKDNVQLAITELPEHSFKTVISGSNNEPTLRSDPNASIVDIRDDRSDGNNDYALDGKAGVPTLGKTNTIGGDQPHENRPPYYVVAFIIRTSYVNANGGKSAYEIALLNGFVGTEAEWLTSLNGKSAYQIALDYGFVGTIDQWILSLKGNKGDNGVGITGIERTSGNGASGTTDTYTINYSNNTSSTYTVVNGSNGNPGENGRGIVSNTRISGNGAAGITDTYRITYTDGSTTDYTVVNGSNGIESIVAGTNVTIDVTDPKKPVINVPVVNGEDGRGIVSHVKTGTVGLVDTYTTTYTDGTTDTYTVTNGSNGTNGSSTETAPYVLSGLDADIKTGVIASHTILEKHQFTAADIYAEVTTMPEVLGIVVDVLKNGVSIFSTKPSIAAGALHSVGTHVLVTSPTVFNAGDIRSISVDQMGVGDGKTGKNLKLSILMHKII